MRRCSLVAAQRINSPEARQRLCGIVDHEQIQAFTAAADELIDVVLGRALHTPGIYCPTASRSWCNPELFLFELAWTFSGSSSVANKRASEYEGRQHVLALALLMRARLAQSRPT